MALLGIDLGGTKLAAALFEVGGSLLSKEKVLLNERSGSAVGKLINDNVSMLIEIAERNRLKVDSIGISVPGISNIETGNVWAPNITGWEEFPLLSEVRKVTRDIPVVIDSDRVCYILGEVWMGNARGCKDAVFLAVGTGIGAGILVNNEVLHGSNNIAGAAGWMALNRPFEDKYSGCGCFEYHASGEGIAKVARELMKKDRSYSGILRTGDAESIKASDLFSAYETGDYLAVTVIEQCIEFWGMAAANIVSLFNPEKIIFGGGVFGPAGKLLPAIRREAARWAQPISITQVSFDVSALGGDSGLYGAAYLALKNLHSLNSSKK
jgi:glucokinase